MTFGPEYNATLGGRLAPWFLKGSVAFGVAVGVFLLESVLTKRLTKTLGAKIKIPVLVISGICLFFIVTGIFKLLHL
jgi:hypothetical protein